MKFLRNKFIHRSVSIFLLLVFVQPIASPYYSFGLTSGAHQPEFTSYEDAGATDMVNLLTGDFMFNMPIIEVPGPEGNFALPLSYHAGIGPEQEASWVGLGFNINAGAILRDINQYPDDALNESNYVTVQNLTGINGFSRRYNHPFKDDWNSQTGYHGNVNLLNIVEVDFGSGGTDVNIVGVHVSDNGITFDPVQFTSAVITILSYGAASGVTTAASAAKLAAISLVQNTAVSFAMPINSPTAPTGGKWNFSTSHGKSSYEFHWKESLRAGLVPVLSKKKPYKIWLDQTRNEKMYGVLYLGNADGFFVTHNNNIVNGVTSTGNAFYNWTNTSGFTESVGSASDINFTIESESSYLNQKPVTVMATDRYTVNAPGVSGSIKPYRLEVGSVAMPRNMSTYFSKYAPLPYLKYKVPFIYEGGTSNSYYYHMGNNLEPGIFNYGMSKSSTGGIDYELNDKIFTSSTNNGTGRIKPVIDPLKKVPQSKHIEWYSNADLRNGTVVLPSPGVPSGFIDFLSNYRANPQLASSDRYDFRNANTYQTKAYPIVLRTAMPSFSTKIPISDPSFISMVKVNDHIDMSLWLNLAANPWVSDVIITSKDANSITISSAPPNYIGQAVRIFLKYNLKTDLSYGIGGYSITGTDGTIYHFALPVFGYDQKTESIDIADANKRSIVTRYAPYVSTWLLTAITGSDFVDRNNNGLADEGDWGYWVKMNYGRHAESNDYEWRIPYAGEMADANNKYKSYETGKKQLYYLNSIETRSHVALFMKSDRQDGISASGSVVPLKLDEICLLKKEHYKTLYTSYGADNYTDNIDKLCTSLALSATTIRNYINKNCLKRVVFNYDYSLCKNTPNAYGITNSAKGRLTLKSISIKGRNDFKNIPDYKFEYLNNPDYNANYWDGWGMYNGNGTALPSSHKTSDLSGSMGSAWSLTKITTPIGSEILLNYERDTYGTISGEPLLETSISYSNPNINYYYPIDLPIKKLWINHNNYFVVGDKVNISGDATYKCPNATSYTSKNYSINNCTVAEVGSNYIKVLEDYMSLGICGATNSGTAINFQSQYGTVSKIIFNKTGGNIRVGSIVMRDEFGKENKLRYIYNDSEGGSSGVVSQEPEYIKTTDFPFYDYLKYPQTPVMYGKVSVLAGRLNTDQDYYSKQEFEFVTPHKSQLDFQSIDQGSAAHLTKRLNKFEDRTSKIGKLKSVKIYDNLNNIVNESQLVYTDLMHNDGANNYQGYYSEGSILTDYMSEGADWSEKLIRTTVLSYPYSLKKIINSKNGITSSEEYLSWDLLTGIATQKLVKSSLGIYVKTVLKPAYTVPAYAELGSKAYSINNKNMLLQNAATYVYRSDAMGNSLGLISADAQTWKKDWVNYRIYDAPGITYKDEGTQTNQIWRKGPAYTWRGDYGRLQAVYGTQSFTVSDEFNFAGTNPAWQYLGEIKRFDHYGMPLESVDLNKDNAKAIYSSVKMGYDNRTIIATASNAKYNEIAFSSAEDKIVSMPTFFGGEVSLGSGTQVSTSVHTGNMALSVPVNTYGFIFKSNELSSTRTYRASVWTNNLNGRIYYKLGGSAEVIPAQTVSAAVNIPGMGNWYRIDMTLKNPSSSTAEVGVKAVGGTAVFDDFRFQPADAVMTCYVYPPLEFEFSVAAPTYSPTYAYSLDNDNLFTKHEVNEKGELIKVYAESLMYGVKLISESKSNLRRFNIDQ